MLEWNAFRVKSFFHLAVFPFAPGSLFTLCVSFTVCQSVDTKLSLPVSQSNWSVSQLVSRSVNWSFIHLVNNWSISQLASESIGLSVNWSASNSSVSQLLNWSMVSQSFGQLVSQLINQSICQSVNWS